MTKLVEISQPGHPYHGCLGLLVQRFKDIHTVEFHNDGPLGPKLMVENFAQENVRYI